MADRDYRRHSDPRRVYGCHPAPGVTLCRLRKRAPRASDGCDTRLARREGGVWHEVATSGGRKTPSGQAGPRALGRGYAARPWHYTPNLLSGESKRGSYDEAHEVIRLVVCARVRLD